VNHIWSKLFGIGLVSTPDDFGTTGEPPSHPELLDWLASEFMRQGWSRKQLIKLIVTSATYKQSSTHRDDIVVIDPLNRLLSRQNRLRLDAEILRDSALAVSGLLKPTIGGPSFRPPLPEDVFDVGRSSNWKASPGDEIYRRSLYIITLRSVLYPTLTTFDAPDAADACVRRERSNTPLQALAMMNDSVFVEAAQSLALRVLRQNPAEAPKRLQNLFRLVLNREPRAEELSRLQAFHAEQKARVQNGGAEALKALGTHEKAVSPPNRRSRHSRRHRSCAHESRRVHQPPISRSYGHHFPRSRQTGQAAGLSPSPVFTQSRRLGECDDPDHHRRTRQRADGARARRQSWRRVSGPDRHHETRA
jgi:hypothetical protein